MFINKIPFLVTITRNLKFGTVEALNDCTATTIAKSLSPRQPVTIIMDSSLRLSWPTQNLKPYISGFPTSTVVVLKNTYQMSSGISTPQRQNQVYMPSTAFPSHCLTHVHLFGQECCTVVKCLPTTG